MRVLGWNAGLLLAGALAAEVIFGTWVFGPNFGFLNVPRNVELRHDLSRVARGAGVALYRKDRYGFRGRYRDPSEIELLAIGGSTTNELYVGEGDTWTDVLRARLAAAGKDIVIANAGVDGHSTVAHIKSFELWFPRVPGLRPRWVLAYVGLNDVDLGAQAVYDRLVESGPLARLRRAVVNNSALYNLFRTVRGALRARELRIVHGERGKLRPFDPPPPLAAGADAQALAAYGRRLRTLAARIRAFGARAIFVTQLRGDSFRIGGRFYATGSAALRARQRLARVNAVTMAVCREVGAVCIDLGKELKLAPEDFYDSLHTLPGGSRKIGEYLAAKLKDVLD